MAKVMLVDKDMSQGNMLADMIKQTHHEVVLVHSVAEADGIFKREPIDLVVLDIVPEADAALAVAGIREGIDAVLQRKIPLVVVAKSFSESAFLLERGDVDVLVEVPTHADQLKQIVEQYVGCKVK